MAGRSRHHHDQPHRYLDQRRLLRVPQGDLPLHPARRGAGAGAVPAADRASRPLLAYTAPASGSAWTRSRTSSAWRSSTQGNAPWKVRVANAATQNSSRRCLGRRMIRWTSTRAAAAAARILCLGAIPTTSRSAAAARSCGWPSSIRTAVPLGGVQRHRCARRGGAMRARCSSPPAGPLMLKSFRDGFMPFVGADVKAVFEELKQRLPGPDLHPQPPGRTPGPSPDRGTDLEHISGSFDPGVRDPQI